MEATVTMTISELDKLRGDIQSAKTRIDELESNEKKVKIIASIRDYSAPGFAEYDHDRRYDKWGRCVSSNYFNGKIKYPTVEKVSFENLDDLMDTLRLEAENKVTDKLFELNNEISTLRSQVVDLDNKRTAAKGNFEEQVIYLKKEHSKQVASLQSEIDELKGQEIEKTKDRQINDLLNEVSRLRDELEMKDKRKWYQLI